MDKDYKPDEGLVWMPSHEIMDLMPSKKAVWGLFLCLLVPLCIFIVVYYARTMWIHYQYPWLSTGLAAWCVVVVLCSGLMAYGAFAKKMKQLNLGHPNINLLLFVSCVGAWLLGFYGGNFTFNLYTKPYYDLLRFGTHKQVNPHHSASQSLMDAGIIEFTKNSTLDLNHKMTFKNNDNYCIAPITTRGGEANSTVSVTEAESATCFWAVGVNCCTKEEYKCGEYKSPVAHSGVRLMSQQQRDFFALAVQKAEAAYDLKACPQPVFVHWLAKPSDEKSAMYEDYTNAFGSGILTYLVFQFIVIIVATTAFARM